MLYGQISFYPYIFLLSQIKLISRIFIFAHDMKMCLIQLRKYLHKCCYSYSNTYEIWSVFYILNKISKKMSGSKFYRRLLWFYLRWELLQEAKNILDKLEEIALHLSHLIPLQRLFQRFFNVSSTIMQILSQFLFTLFALFVFMMY